MAKLNKRVKALNEAVDKTKSYTALEAVKVVKQVANAKFDETIEIVFRLGVDPKHADQNIRGAVVLPNGTGKTQKVLVVTKGDNVKLALDAGADFAGAEEMVEKIQKENWFEFDVIIATPDMMPILGRLGRVLGPKGLMPNPKTGTVTTDVVKAVNDVKSGKVEYRVDKEGNLHAIIGKVSFSESALVENFKTVYDAILKAKPSTAKGTYFKNISISSSMGPGLKVTSESLV